jgi:hypothetical protein
MQLQRCVTQCLPSIFPVKRPTPPLATVHNWASYHHHLTSCNAQLTNKLTATLPALPHQISSNKQALIKQAHSHPACPASPDIFQQTSSHQTSSQPPCLPCLARYLPTNKLSSNKLTATLPALSHQISASRPPQAGRRCAGRLRRCRCRVL